MDPITQGALGAAASQAWLDPHDKRAWWLGALGGMAADLDVLIRSSSAPMLGLIYHRHFTHSLLFVPLGGLLVALPWLYKYRKTPALARKALAATTIGYATHALLDAFTSYGTLLWWPFSHQRVAWSVVAIIDPRYTLPLLIGVFLSRRRKTRFWVCLSLVWSVLYLAACAYQRDRAMTLQDELIAARNITATAREVFPQIGSPRRWRSIYRVGQKAQVDELWLGWISPPKIAPGPAHPVLDTRPPPISPGPTDQQTLRWFGKAWLYETHTPKYPRLWCDGRLALHANAFEPAFCFEMDKQERAVQKASPPLDRPWLETLKILLWPSPELRPAKEVLKEAARSAQSSAENTSTALHGSPKNARSLVAFRQQ